MQNFIKIRKFSYELQQACTLGDFFAFDHVNRRYKRACVTVFFPEDEKHGIVVERRSTRANSAAQVRQRQFGAAFELVGATRGAPGDTLASAGSGRGQGHRGAAPGTAGQTLTD